MLKSRAALTAYRYRITCCAKLAAPAEVPTLDRPVRFVVYRGQRGSVRARTLEELQSLLDAPWTEEEVARFNRKRDEQREANRDKRRDRVTHEAKRGLREGPGASGRPGKRERSRTGEWYRWVPSHSYPRRLR